MPLTVAEFFKDNKEDLQLELLAGSKGLSRIISVYELNRPGLSLAGFFDHFRHERVQVLGRGEYAYIRNVALKTNLEPIKNFLRFKIPCLIISHHVKPEQELIDLADQFDVPLFLSSLETANLVGDLSTYLEEKISPTITMHGVLVDVYGLGVFISGDSGIGKSECALELIKRGHMLVSDDIVRVQHRSGGILVGSPVNDMIKHHMEVRGLGIIDVKQLFGVSAVLDSTKIELIVHLETWVETKEYDRVGLEQNTLGILGVRVPKILMPVRPGRNLAVLIEVAALYQRLKIRGINTAQDVQNKLLQTIAEQSSKNNQNEK